MENESIIDVLAELVALVSEIAETTADLGGPHGTKNLP
jgi:hypothetical protein